MAVKREKVHFESVEELLGSSAVSDGMTEIRIDQIHSFKNHPFRVTDDEKMSDLIQSVKENGILVPVMVRPDADGSYETILYELNPETGKYEIVAGTWYDKNGNEIGCG